MDVLSYSGGVQSTALLVMAVKRKINVDVAIFVDLGAAENPRTLDYVYEYAMPHALENQIDFRVVYFNAIWDIFENPKHPKPPFRIPETKSILRRQCTNNWKIRPFRRMLRKVMREYGVRNDVNVMLGISYDEIERMSDTNVKYYKHSFPLIDMKLTRDDCARIIAEEGLPVPPKSACWFCPYAPRARFYEIASQNLAIKKFAREIEEKVNRAREADGLPLIELVPGEIDASPCSGHCMT